MDPPHPTLSPKGARARSGKALSPKKARAKHGKALSLWERVG